MNLLKIALVCGLIVAASPASMAWWDDNWDYRQPITINNANNVTLTDYQVAVNVTYDSGMAGDFSDIRFAWLNYTDGKEKETPHWVESRVNSSWAHVWINVKNIPVGVTTVYLYYGNRNAINSTSNPTATFLAYDEKFDLSKWLSSNHLGYNCGSVSQDTTMGRSLPSMEMIHCTSVNLADGGQTMKIFKNVTISSSDPTGYKIDVDIYQNSGYRRLDSLAWYWNDTTGDGYWARFETNGGSTDNGGVRILKVTDYIWGNGTIASGNAWNYMPSGWYHVNMTISGNAFNASFFRPDGTFMETIGASDSSYTSGSLALVGEWVWFVGQTSWYDNFKVRKFVDPEPTYSFGSKEVKQVLTMTIGNLPHTINLNQQFNMTLGTMLNGAYLTALQQNSFTLYIDGNPLTIENFANNNGGTYTLTASVPYNLLGRRQIKVQVSYNNMTASNSSSLSAMTHRPLNRAVFVTDGGWRDALSLVSFKRPTIISNAIGGSVMHYIDLYRPDTIYVLGSVSGSTGSYEGVTYRITDYSDIHGLFYGNSTGVYAGDDMTKNIHASLLAASLGKDIVFNPSYADSGHDLSGNTTGEIEDLYLRTVKGRGGNINYLVASNYNPLSALVAADRNGFVILNESTDNVTVYRNIVSAANRLGSYGFYANNTGYVLDGSYLLLMGGIRPFVRPDPVEAGRALYKAGILEDTMDGDSFTTDTDFADLNNDTRLDVAVGRLPDNDTLASLMFARTFLPDSKKALVMAEYLQKNWAAILVADGGGMWGGASVASILKGQGYSVDRLVEHRMDPKNFVGNLTPTKINEFVEKSRDIGEKIGSFLGKSAGEFASRAMIYLQVARYGEEALESYLEYDWGSIKPRWGDALEYVAKNIPHDATNLKDYEPLATAIIADYIWPEPIKSLNRSNVIGSMPSAGIIHYEGIGNGSAWVFPNELPEDRGLLDYKDFLEDSQYNGSNTFHPEDVPDLSARVVWDNSNLAATGNMSRTIMTKGAASFIGASAVNYAPTSSEIYTRFFKYGSTAGQALMRAVNSFGDIMDLQGKRYASSGALAKVWREFALYGDPAMQKDPIIERQDYNQTTGCDNFVCTTTVTMPVRYDLSGEDGITTIETDSDSYLTEPFRPAIPLKEFEYFLPTGSSIISSSVTGATSVYHNITVATTGLASYGGDNITYSGDTNGSYPANAYSLKTDTTIDNRVRVKMVHAALQYDSSSQDATVFDSINLTMSYTSPLELYASANDVILGQTVSIPITVWSNVSDNATLYVTVENGTDSETSTQGLTMVSGRNDLSFSYTPPIAGTYKASIVLVKQDPLTLGPREVTFSAISDTTPPVTTDSSDGKWHYDGQIIPLACSDDMSGCNQTLYCLDTSGTCAPSAVYSSPISVTCVTGGTCTYYVRYNSVDNFGNWEQAKTSNPIKIDMTVPARKAKFSEITTGVNQTNVRPPVANNPAGPVCGNGVCESGENPSNCPQDCAPAKSGKTTSPATGFFAMLPSAAGAVMGAASLAVIGALLYGRARKQSSVRGRHLHSLFQ